MTMDNVPKGAVGGLVGGAVGGIAFDLIGAIAGGGLASRFFGEAVTGLAIGLFIGLVQELTKAAWVTVEQGRLRGRQYRIEGARATIGRAEENPIGLFGDPSVQQRHAIIERRGADYVIRNIAIQEGTFVNGKRIETVDLRDGDRINIGGYEMTFHLRGTSASARATGVPRGRRGESRAHRDAAGGSERQGRRPEPGRRVGTGLSGARRHGDSRRARARQRNSRQSFRRSHGITRVSKIPTAHSWYETSTARTERSLAISA